MAPSRGPFSEMERKFPALSVTLVVRFSFSGKRSMKNKVFQYDLGRLRHKKGVKLEYLDLRFDKETEGRKSRTEEEWCIKKKGWRKEMAALRKALVEEVESEVRPLGGEMWRTFCAESDREIRREEQRREEEAEEEMHELQVDTLQRDVDRWWNTYGCSQSIMHDALPRLHKKRKIRGEIFTRNKRNIERALSVLYEKG